VARPTTAKLITAWAGNVSKQANTIATGAPTIGASRVGHPLIAPQGGTIILFSSSMMDVFQGLGPLL